MPEREYLPDWEKLKKQEKRQKEELERLGWEKARCVAAYLKQQWQVEKVWVIGSLAQGRFGINSDLDLVLKGFRHDRHYFRILDECQTIAVPFSVDLLLLEELPPGWEKHLRNGVEV